MAAAAHQEDRRLVSAVIDGERAALARFLERAPDCVWSTIAVFMGEGDEAREAFTWVIEALRANDFARLRRYDGRSGLETFLVLATRELLAERAAGAFGHDSNLAWRRFAQIFGPDIRRRVRRRFPRADESLQDDYYQQVCLGLVEDNFRRIRSYKGHGSFSCYILGAVNNLLIDLMRGELRRRRLPAEIKRLSRLHQQVFVAGAWDGVLLDVDSMRLALMGKLRPAPDLEELRAVIDQLARVIAEARGSVAKPTEVSIDTDAGQGAAFAIADVATAEGHLIDREEEQAENALLSQIWSEAERLAVEDRFFLQIVLQPGDPLPPREIAKLMALPVEDVYRLRQRTIGWIKQIAAASQKKPDPVRLTPGGAPFA